MPKILTNIWTSIIEYETPRLVRIHNRKLGLVRRLIQFSIVCYVLVYALWLQKGYQEFTRVESSITVKIKGVTKSELGEDTNNNPDLYTRVWDVADYVVPPAENGAFFVATNVIITANQTRGQCPEDHIDVKRVTCQPNLTDCSATEKGPSESLKGFHKCRAQGTQCPQGKTIFKAHGPLTGYCVPSDRPHHNTTYACEVESWCPIEIDKLPLGDERALMQKSEDYTVFIKNSVAFPYFGHQFARNNLIGKNGRPCMYKATMDGNNGCQIFRLGDIITLAGGNFSKIAIRGGVVAISIAWNCNLDRDFMTYCLPHYTFRILDDFGWNFRHAKYHEEHRRSLYKMYGIKFIVNVEGQGGKFNLKNTILNIGSGLALLGVSTVVCDFLLMYIKEKGVVKKKKYDYIDVEEILAARDEARRKLEESQLRRRNLISNISKKWKRNTTAANGRSHKNRNSLTGHSPLPSNNPKGTIAEHTPLRDSSSHSTILRENSSNHSIHQNNFNNSSSDNVDSFHTSTFLNPIHL